MWNKLLTSRASNTKGQVNTPSPDSIILDDWSPMISLKDKNLAVLLERPRPTSKGQINKERVIRITGSPLVLDNPFTLALPDRENAMDVKIRTPKGLPMVLRLRNSGTILRTPLIDRDPTWCAAPDRVCMVSYYYETLDKLLC